MTLNIIYNLPEIKLIEYMINSSFEGILLNFIKLWLQIVCSNLITKLFCYILIVLFTHINRDFILHVKIK